MSFLMNIVLVNLSIVPLYNFSSFQIPNSTLLLSPRMNAMFFLFCSQSSRILKFILRQSTFLASVLSHGQLIFIFYFSVHFSMPFLKHFHHHLPYFINFYVQLSLMLVHVIITNFSLCLHEQSLYDFSFCVFITCNTRNSYNNLLFVSLISLRIYLNHQNIIFPMHTRHYLQNTQLALPTLYSSSYFVKY